MARKMEHDRRMHIYIYNTLLESPQKGLIMAPMAVMRSTVEAREFEYHRPPTPKSREERPA